MAARDRQIFISYKVWKSANGITDDFGDPDGDGLNNLGEVC